MIVGRTFAATSGKYRYGFNGKQYDSEWDDGGAIYDYGFRIYNPRLGKFLSVDPLTRSYPMLTPYQFASNRPIDGVDLDGLEYVEYHILLNPDGTMSIIHVIDYREMSEEQANQIHNTTDFYKKYSESFGPKGRGISYVFYRSVPHPEGGKRLAFAFDIMRASGTLIAHGLFYGSGTPTKFGEEYDPKHNPYLFSLAPIDEVDAIAKAHDKDYDQPWYNDGGWRNDPSTLIADYLLVFRLEDYINRATQDGYVDKITGRAPSEEAIQSAENAIFFFKRIILVKTFILYKMDPKKAEEIFKRWDEIQSTEPEIPE
ncbi:MAG: hypothetical protein M3Q97_05270 [Bacteroidota bacterium]|nr:hypothetical protein [Bacteroidota bacterium]